MRRKRRHTSRHAPIAAALFSFVVVFNPSWRRSGLVACEQSGSSAVAVAHRWGPWQRGRRQHGCRGGPGAAGLMQTSAAAAVIRRDWRLGSQKGDPSGTHLATERFSPRNVTSAQAMASAWSLDMRLTTLIAVSAPLLFAGSAAQAMPAQTAGALAVAPQISLVAGGCGPGYHRGALGRCRPNFGYGRRLSYGVGGGPHRTTATGGNAGGYSSRN